MEKGGGAAVYGGKPKLMCCTSTMVHADGYSSNKKHSVSAYTETESYQTAGQSPHRKHLL